jgi:hypothetical protein
VAGFLRVLKKIKQTLITHIDPDSVNPFYQHQDKENTTVRVYTRQRVRNRGRQTAHQTKSTKTLEALTNERKMEKMASCPLHYPPRTKPNQSWNKRRNAEGRLCPLSSSSPFSHVDDSIFYHFSLQPKKTTQPRLKISEFSFFIGTENWGNGKEAKKNFLWLLAI